MRLLLLSLLAALTAVNPLVAETPDEELARLRKEVQTLRDENQKLRRLLATPTAPAMPVKAAPAASPAGSDNAKPETSDAADTGYWLSSTGKRHNSKCRFYKTGSGHFCGATEGVACKVCGG